MKKWLNALALFRTQDFGRWLGKGFWTVMDRGLFATSNFVLTVLLARWLTPQDFGAFVVAYTVLWFLGTAHNGLLAEPMLVFGPGKYKARLPEYLGVLLYGHLGFAALSSFLLLIAGLGLGFAGSDALYPTFLSLAFASPFILYQWLIRQACYVRLNPRLAASGGALYMLLMLSGAYALYQRDWLSGATALILMGFASFLASLLLIARLHVSLPSLTGNGFVREAFGGHLGYGRWAVPTRMLTWVPDNVYYLALPVFSSLESTAALRAIMNLIMPAMHLLDALSIILLPLLVQVRGDVRFKQIVVLTLALFTSSAVLFWVLLGLFHRPLVTWLYGGQYDDYAYLLWLLGSLPLFLGMLAVLGAALRALERPNRVFWAYALSTVSVLTVGLGSLVALGVTGAVVGYLVSSIVAVGALTWFLLTTGPTPTKVEDTDSASGT